MGWHSNLDGGSGETDGQLMPKEMGNKNWQHDTGELTLRSTRVARRRIKDVLRGCLGRHK